jgi:Mg/Co/Ni transporter MgtE
VVVDEAGRLIGTVTAREVLDLIEAQGVAQGRAEGAATP